MRIRLILLFYHTYLIQETNGSKYKSLVEKYAIFEHLEYNDLLVGIFNDNELRDEIDKLLVTYARTAFGKSKTINRKLDMLTCTLANSDCID